MQHCVQEMEHVDVIIYAEIITLERNVRYMIREVQVFKWYIVYGVWPQLYTAGGPQGNHRNCNGICHTAQAS